MVEEQKEWHVESRGRYCALRARGVVTHAAHGPMATDCTGRRSFGGHQSVVVVMVVANRRMCALTRSPDRSRTIPTESNATGTKENERPYDTTGSVTSS